ncbi:hypothetical protein AAFF_G00100800 [Aldrovandia affinis]|uniref:Uncharacterized protein n=1 Tax=Aldrovandia affinis TaxID=143900 RepID=A0AAD7RUX4_9TELE|nr:hypothetical protein AAFF_G00100800 [Aldrovandia affinis]
MDQDRRVRSPPQLRGLQPEPTPRVTDEEKELALARRRGADICLASIIHPFGWQQRDPGKELQREDSVRCHNEPANGASDWAVWLCCGRGQ